MRPCQNHLKNSINDQENIHVTDAVNLPTFSKSQKQRQNVDSQRNVIEEHEHFLAQHALSYTPRIKLLVDIVSLINLTELILLVSGCVFSF